MIRKHRVTLTTTGSAGSAVATSTLTLGRPGFVRAIKVDYHASAPSTTDLVIKADSSSGTTIFTKSNSATDFGPSPVAMPGIDEGGAATAATDVGSGGFPFGTGLYFDVAQSDALTGALVVDVWLET